MRVRNVSLSYGAEPVLEGASLEVGAGKFVSLVGPSGSGKSSLLRAAMGLQKPFAGTVDLDSGCRYMVDRVLRRQFLIIPGRRARLTWWMQKLLPRSVTNALADRMVARAHNGTR